MKTILIATHQISFSDPESLYNCLGVLTLSAALKKRQLDCEVLDLYEYNNLYARDYNEILDSIVEKILDAKPNILGFSAMINNLAIALELASRIKKIDQDVFIVFGGPGTAFCAQDVLTNFSQVDVIFRGEVDFIFPEYIESLINGQTNNSLKGLIYRSGSEIVDNGWPDPIQSLDDLPIPDFQFQSASYITQTSTKYGDYNGVSIETGRGCPFICNFCSTSLYFKRKYRLKSIDRVIEEIQLIKNRIGSARIIFNHDLFTLRRTYVLDFCRQIQQHVPGIVWKCHARLDTLDEEILTKMNQAGCNEIFVGLESATEKMQKIIQKKLDLDKFDLLIEIADRLNMRFSLSFIVGFPEEDENDIREIFAYCLRAKSRCRDKVQVKIHSLVPLVGSPLYEQWKDKLVYDEYGSIGTTDIPYSWKPLRDIIKPHPEIFSLYFHLPIGESKRTNSSKFGYLGLIIEKLMIHSIALAYDHLGDKVADLFVQNIDQVILPPPASLKNSEYHILAESIRVILLAALADYPEIQKKYDTLARYEIAILEGQTSKNEDFIKIIDVFFNPDEILEYSKNRQTMAEIDRTKMQVMASSEKRYFMIFRDKNDNRMKNTEISPDFASLFKG